MLALACYRKEKRENDKNKKIKLKTISNAIKRSIVRVTKNHTIC